VKRRLSDKVMDAVQLAVSQGREEFARRLELIYQAIYQEEVQFDSRRRQTDEYRDDDDDGADEKV